MLIDRPQVVEGSAIQNATVPSGTSFPAYPNAGELFYNTSGVVGLYAYNGAAWEVAAKGLDLVNHIADTTLHLTAVQNTLLDGINVLAADVNSIPAVTSRVTTLETNLSTHVADTTVHISPAQNTFLDGLNLPTLTSAAVNFTSDLTSAVQAQLNAIVGVNNQQTSDIANLQSSSSAGQSSLQSQLSNHIADDTVHLTPSQNTLLDNINVGYQDINKLSGLSSFLGATALASYLATLNNTKLSINGSIAMTGNLSMGGQRIVNLATPTAASDAATKDYVDNFVQGLHWVGSVAAATTGPISLSGLQTIDGVSLSAGARVLVKDQTDTTQNGIWVVDSNGWPRASDYDTAIEINKSAVFVLSGGTANGKSTWLETANVTGSPGSQPITFTAFSGPTFSSAGNGLTLTPAGLASVNAGGGIKFDSGSLPNNVTLNLYSGGGLMLTTNGSASSTATNAGLSLAGVGTAGTYRSVTTNAFGQVTSGTNPTTIAGYGLTDAAKTDGSNASGTWPISAQYAVNETLQTVTGRSGTTSNFITVTTPISGNFITAYKAGGTYSDTLGAFLAKVDNTNGAANYFYQGTVNGNTTFMVRADGQINTSGPVFASGFYGDGGGLTGTANGLSIGGNAGSANSATNATNATNASNVPWQGVSGKPARTTWVGVDSIGVVVGQLGWKNYGNNHTIFDASASTSPDGNSIDRTNAANAWNVAICPTLMGWNGAATYGVRVDSARLSDATSQTTFGRVRTDGINRGSYGSISVSGNTNGYAGIDFTDNSATLMITGSISGVFRNNNAWDWYFTNGVLTQGQVPGASVIGNVSSATTASSVNMSAGRTDSTPYPVVWGTTGSTSQLYSASSVTIQSSTGILSANQFNGSGAGLTGTAGSLTAGNAASISSAVGGSYTWTGGYNYFTSPNVGVGSSGAASGLMAYSNGGAAAMSFHRPGAYAINWGLDTDNVMRLGGWSDGASTYRMQIDTAGNVTFRGDITGFSDERTKKDIATIENAGSKVAALRGVTYTKKSDDTKSLGVIAQEVQKVLPEAVVEDPDGTLGVKYGNLVGLLIEAIKELQLEVAELKAAKGA